MNRTIKDVRWANDRKSQIFCKFHYEDGRIVEAYITDTDQGNPDWKEIMETFGPKVLDENTQVYLRNINKKRDFERQRQKEREEVMKNEMLFNAKLEAFSMEEIKGSKNTELKSKIRKAKSLMEIQTYSSALVTMELMKNEKAPEATEPTEEPETKPKRKYTKKTS